MKPTRVAFLLPLVILLAMWSFHRPTNLFRAQSGQSTAPACCGEAVPHELDFAYYTLRDGFISTVTLVSASPQAFSFTVAIHSRSGQTVLAPAVTIQPQQKLSIDVGQLLSSLAADVTGNFSDGSVAVYFKGTPTMLASQLTMTNPAQSALLGSLIVDNSPGLTTVPAALHTLWWGMGSGREALIRVANTSAAAVVADVFLDFQGARHPSPALTFAPFETKVLSVADLLGALNISPAQAPEGGLSIVSRGPVPALIAQGRISDATTGFSTPLHFPDISLHKASALHATGLPVGAPTNESPYAGTGKYTPHVIARNLTSSPQSILTTLEYPGTSGPVIAPLCALTLTPYATTDIPLDAAPGLLSAPVPHASIRIQYSGPPGSVIAEVASIDQRGEVAVSGYAENAGNNFAGSGAHAWHLDSQTESILYLSNLGEQECPIGMRVQAKGVPYYVTDVRLKAHETRQISLRQLRDAQKADFKGHKISADATDGTVLWTRLKNLPVTGQLDVVSNGELVTPELSSGCCCPANYQGLSITPAYPYMQAGTQLQLTATLATMDCNGVYNYFDWTDGVLWTSSATTVATVNNSTAPGLVTAVAGGTSNIVANGGDWQQYMCCGLVCNPCAQVPIEGGTTLSVTAPARLVHSDDSPCAPGGVGAMQVITNGSVVDCSGKPLATSFCGVSRNVTYQLVDTTGTAFKAAYNIQESFSNFSTTNSAFKQPTATNASIAAGGLVNDTPFVGFTYPACLGSNDNVSYTQTFTVTVNGIPYPLSTVVSISMGSFNGTLEDNVPITTP